jgi:hypothetical protein
MGTHVVASIKLYFLKKPYSIFQPHLNDNFKERAM